jgi:hypothetical protein
LLSQEETQEIVEKGTEQDDDDCAVVAKKATMQEELVEGGENLINVEKECEKDDTMNEKIHNEAEEEATIKESLMEKETHVDPNEKLHILGKVALQKEILEKDVNYENKKGESESEKVNLAMIISQLQEQHEQYTTPKKDVVYFVDPISYAKPQEPVQKKEGRPQRKKMFSEALCSPFLQRQVVMEQKRTVTENNISAYINAAIGPVWYNF